MSKTTQPKKFTDKLRHYLDACCPAIWIQTHEEARISKEIFYNFHPTKNTKALNCKVYEWDSLQGLYEKVDDDKKQETKDSTDPLVMFAAVKQNCINGSYEEAVVIIKDFHLQFEKQLKKPDYIRAFKNLINILKVKRTTLIFISPVMKIPTEIVKDIQSIEYSLPDEGTIGTQFDFILEQVNQELKEKNKITATPEMRQAAINAAKGMTESEIEGSFSLGIVEHKRINEDFVRSVFNEKIMQVKKGGLLTHLDTSITFDNVGGLGEIKNWIRTRRNAFSDEARAYGLPYLKGLGLCGIAGTGKTLISKAIANEFNFPLFQLDLGSLFSKYVGEQSPSLNCGKKLEPLLKIWESDLKV